MNLSLPYSSMLVFIITILICIFFLYHKRQLSETIGFLSWISLLAYFPIEYLVIQATTVPYNFLKQPMSDLGVTTCGGEPYALAFYEVCSPYHLLMNWTFTLTGLAIIIGAVFLQRYWQSRIATMLLVVFGLSYTISGLIPADVNFLWHTLPALPGMVVQIPALILIGLAFRSKMPKLSLWTFVCAFVTTFALLLLFLQPFFNELPGGLLQRILYGAVYVWMTTAGIVLWLRKSEIEK